MKLSATTSSPPKSPARISVSSARRSFSAPRSPQTPSLPDAGPNSGRARCGGRKSNFLASSFNEAYDDKGRPNGNDLRSLETGVNLTALAKYWGLGK